MGMCGSETTTTVTTGDMSSRGLSYDTMYSEMLKSNLREFGDYEINTEQKFEYQDQPRADRLFASLADRQKQIDAANASGDTRLASSLQAQQDKDQRELDGIKRTPYFDYNLKKKEDLRVQSAIARYGEDSPQVRAARIQVQTEQVAKVESLAATEGNWLKNVKKFTSGDYSYTPTQYNQISKFITPIQEIIKKTTDDLLAQYGSDDTMLRDALNRVSSEIDKTGFAVGDALQAAQVQIEKSGATLMDTLKGVNESSFAKAKFQFDLLSEKADIKTAQQAAMLGLPPGSQAEKIAASKIKNDALKQIELDLASQTAQGTMNIQSGVEQGKQQISLARVDLAQTQGGKKEGVAQQGFGLTQFLTQKIDQTIGQRGNALVNAEQQRQQMLYGAAYGNLPQQIQAGQSALAFDKAQKAADQQMQQQLLGSVAQQLGIEQQRSFAETTTKQETKKGFLDAFTDILGAGASLAGSIYGMAGGGGGGGSSGGGGGGGGPQTFMPVMDYSVYNAGNAIQNAGLSAARPY